MTRFVVIAFIACALSSACLDPKTCHGAIESGSTGECDFELLDCDDGTESLGLRCTSTDGITSECICAKNGEEISRFTTEEDFCPFNEEDGTSRDLSALLSDGCDLDYTYDASIFGRYITGRP